MATSTQTPALTAPEQKTGFRGLEGEQGAALVPVHPDAREMGAAIPLARGVALLPVELDVAVPVTDFRVRNLLALECGQVVETRWGHGDDVPLAAGQVQLAWSEFEVVDSLLGVRVTRLA